MALDIKLRRIIPKSAGTYFIVRDNSQVTELETENKMRLIFINVEQGPVNVAVNFAKGDKEGFTSIFGKSTRKMKKAGNFSIDVCLDALEAGPISVINLRKFDDKKHTAGVAFMNANGVTLTAEKNEQIPYRKFFSTNTFWTPAYNNMNSMGKEASLLQFGNVGNSKFSIFVTKSTEKYKQLTNEGDNSLKSTSLKIEEFPALMGLPLKIKDTMVDVWLFNQDFEEVGTDTNRYFGHLFTRSTNDKNIIDITRLEELAKIPEAGFSGIFTGSLIPNLTSETNQPISINDVINQHFMETGLICDINEDVLEQEYNPKSGVPFIDLFGTTIYNFETGAKKPGKDTSKSLLSHILTDTLTIVEHTGKAELNTDSDKSEFEALITLDKYEEYKSKIVKFNVLEVEDATQTSGKSLRKFTMPFEYGVRIGDLFVGKNENQPLVEVVGIENIETKKAGQDDNEFEWTQATFICDGDIKFSDDSEEPSTDKEIIRVTDVTSKNVYPITLSAVVTSPEQFLDGSPAIQKEILSMINDPGIVRGIIGMNGIRYVIDAFKSFVEAGYKHEFGALMETLDNSNKFVRTIANEPFIEDMMNSINPLFKNQPNGSFDLSHLSTGGNTVYSSKMLTKPTIGGEYVFFFGPGYKRSDSATVVYPLSGKISNLFYLKENAFDVVANANGILDGVSELEYNFDDNERMYLEKFLYNPIIRTGSTIRIFQNLTAYPKRTSNQQIHNSELLAYIKETLNSLAKNEAFTKGNYDDYLRTETECKDFMQSLALAGAIEPNPIVICSEKNNTKEIRKQKIKLVHIEYTPIDALDKVVFDLTIN